MTDEHNTPPGATAELRAKLIEIICGVDCRVVDNAHNVCDKIMPLIGGE